MFWILILFILIFLLYCWKNHLVIRFDTFFRKGFEKNDDDYRDLLHGTVSRVTERHIQFLIV